MYVFYIVGERVFFLRWWCFFGAPGFALVEANINIVVFLLQIPILHAVFGDPKERRVAVRGAVEAVADVVVGLGLDPPGASYY